MDILTTIQGIQANYVELNTKFTRTYDAFKLAYDEIERLKKRVSALEVALASLSVTTVDNGINGIEILVNGVSIGNRPAINIEGDEEISISAVDDSLNSRVNVFIELESLAQRFQLLVRHLNDQGIETPELICDLEKSEELEDVPNS